MNANANDNAVGPGWRAIITLCGIVGTLLDLALGLGLMFLAALSLCAALFALFTGQGWPPAVRVFSDPATQALVMTAVAVHTVERWAKRRR